MTVQGRYADANESVELIRRYCDNGLRHFAWALKRMPYIPRQVGETEHVQDLMSSLAHVLAFIEGAREERTAILARDDIVRRYRVIIETEEWQPPFPGRYP